MEGSTERDLEHMKDPTRWSRWPLQSLSNKTNKSQGGFPEIGFLRADGGPIVYLGNVFTVDKTNLGNLHTENYSTFEDLIAAGWRVD